MYDRVYVAGVKITDRPIGEVEKPTVLYAPTGSGNSSDLNYSSLSIGEKIVSKLLARGATVIFRPHPYTKRNPASAQQMARVEQLLARDADKERANCQLEEILPEHRGGTTPFTRRRPTRTTTTASGASGTRPDEQRGYRPLSTRLWPHSMIWTS